MYIIYVTGVHWDITSQGTVINYWKEQVEAESGALTQKTYTTALTAPQNPYPYCLYLGTIGQNATLAIQHTEFIWYFAR